MKKIDTFIDSLSTLQTNNPLIERPNLPYDVPAFDIIRVEHYKPAIEWAMKVAQKRIMSISDSTEAPSFDNTIVALETATTELDMIVNIMMNLNECDTSDELQAVVMEMTPIVTQFENDIMMNKSLFERIKSVHDDENITQHLHSEQMMLLNNTYKSFVRGGALLNDKDQKEFANIEEQLSQLDLKFSKNVLADTNDFMLHITESEQLSHLPQTLIDLARNEASKRGLNGWVFTLQAPSYVPFMSHSACREHREAMWRAYNSRGNRSNEHNNAAIIAQIVSLRQRKAELLGYKNFVEMTVCERMVGSSQRLSDFMTRLTDCSYKAATKDLAAVQAHAEKLRFTEQLKQWDFSFYSEQLKRSLFEFDSEQLRPYLAHTRVLEGIFGLYKQLYNINFIKLTDLPVYNDEVMVFKVADGERFMGLLYIDLFARESKRGGAWMTKFRPQANINDESVRPLVQVVCNFSQPPTKGAPSLLSFGEFHTLMHEMGHAMHALLSDVTYPSLSCTRVMRDFVELPSQLMENWCYEPTFLSQFAHHIETNEPLPYSYIEKIKLSENFNAGWLSLRQINFGLIDLAYHNCELTKEHSIEQFEHHHMLELLPSVEGCCSSTSFTHIFSGGYASGYYGYKWAESLDADVFSKFAEEGIMNVSTAQKFRQDILSKGGSEHPLTLFRKFMGREPNPDAMLIRSGLLHSTANNETSETSD